MKYPTQDKLKESLIYDKYTGLLKRKFKSGNIKSVSTKPNKHGYLRVSVDNKLYYSHRIIWLICYGVEPDLIDHINGDKSDNRISNLRDVTSSINSMNSKKSITNKSGISGVSFHNRSRTWRSEITVNRKRIVLGNFKTLFEASCSRISEQIKHDFTDRHGR